MTIINNAVGNWDERRGNRPKLVVIHITDDLRPNVVLNTFNNAKEAKSSHYLALQNGIVWRMVAEEKNAWANGLKVRPTAKLVKELPDSTNPNWVSVSIEIIGVAEFDASEAQYVACAELVRDICQRWDIPIDRDHIIGHREIRADKSCPAKISVDRILEMAKPKGELELRLSLMQRILDLMRQLLILKAQLGRKLGAKSCN